MAKQIKAIKCPSCGSTHKTEIKPEHYQCDNCNTEYFLDNDDININVSHKSAEPVTFFHFLADPKNRITQIIYALAVIIIFSFIIFIKIASETKKSPPPYTPPTRTITSNTNQNTNTSTPPVVKKAPTIYYKYCSTIISQDAPYILTIEETQPSMNKYEHHFVIHDLLNNKIAKKTLIDGLIPDKFKQVQWDYLSFTPTKTYFINNNKQVYLLDKNQFKFTEITKSLLKNHPDYQTGIASVTIARTTSGNALHILTNDGKKIYYYPLIDEVYLDNYDFHMVKNRPKRPPADNSEHIAFDFTDNWRSDFKLIKFSYINYYGKNNITPRSSRVGEYKLGGPDGKHSDPDSAYDLIPDDDRQTTVVDHKNLTPGRLYFDPSVIYYDDNTLVIKTKVNAAPDADYNYQQIDTETGAVLWTIPDNKINISSIVVYKDLLIAKESCGDYALIDKSGNISKKVKLTYE
ncbi:hypothetical protein RCS94_08880 [Orbaceae bacterium ac157xtp]